MKMNARLCTGLLMAVLAAGCASVPTDTVVLLPHADGSTGAVVMKQDGKEALLDTPYASARSGKDGAPTTGRESEESVRKQFGPALGAQPPPPRSFTVYFVIGSDEFTEESKLSVIALLTEMANRPSPEITAIGHTDRLGTDQINDALSLQRAQRVKEMLIERGVASERITVAGRGEREPLVPTADEVAEARNRRVEINVR
jgi:outer membrane protein OmpA-like peptidoglycan-associated protein